MAETVESQTPVAATNSGKNLNFEEGAFRAPRYHIYVYNIGNKEHTVRRPPQLPLLLIKACPEGKAYVQAYEIPEWFHQVDEDLDTGLPRVRYIKAEAMAQDIVAPLAPDMDSPIPHGALSSGIDLRAQGVFWSRNNPPTEADLKKAAERRETRYRQLLQEGYALQNATPKEQEEKITEDHHLAAEYFGEEFSWHRKLVKKKPEAARVECPNCGDPIKATAAFHRDAEGDLCVIDWKRTYEAGKVKLEDVPDSKRWDKPSLEALNTAAKK